MTQADLARSAKVSSITISNLVTGKTENPQPGTRRKIENALRQSGKKEGEPPPTIDPNEPVVGIRYEKNEYDQAPSEVGVYVIHDKRGWPTYVGKGNIRNELRHYSEQKWAHSHSARTFSYALIDNDKDADRIETIVIKFMADSLLVNTKKRASVAER